MKHKRLALIGVLAIVSIGLVVLVFTNRSTPATNIVYISGLDSCSKDITEDRVEELGEDMYSYVASANDFNKIKSSPTYKADARESTCQRKAGSAVKGYDGYEVTVYTSSVVLDIPDAKQSWYISYDWLPNDNDSTDLGSLIIGCPATDKLKFGNFNCQKVMNIQKYGTPDYDPILEYMPYQGQGFNLDYSPSNKQVIASIVIPTKQKDNQELIENNKAVIPYWFQKRKLDINKYTVIYRVVYE